MSVQETSVLTTQEVANRFYELAEQGQFENILNELFSEDAKSIEPEGPFKTVQGLDEIRKKGAEWNSMVKEMHSGYTTKPMVAGDYFTCTMGMDVTLQNNQRMNMEEVCVYNVNNGKIVSEQFFFNANSEQQVN